MIVPAVTSLSLSHAVNHLSFMHCRPSSFSVEDRRGAHRWTRWLRGGRRLAIAQAPSEWHEQAFRLPRLHVPAKFGRRVVHHQIVPARRLQGEC